MASTILANVNYLAQPFADTLAGEFTHRLSLYNGILVNGAPYITPDSGTTQAIPKWDVVSGDSEVITTSSTTTINNLTDMKDVGVWCEREKGWGADQMVKIVAGSDKDVTEAVASQIGEYWAKEIHRMWLKAATGVFTTALAGTHVKDDSGATINIPGILAAKQLLGDNMDMLQYFVMNSKVYSDALNDKIVTFDKAVADTYNTGSTGNILGMTPSYTDTLEVSGGAYPSYIGARGAGLFLTRKRESNNLTNANLFDISANGINVQVELNRVAKTAGGQDEILTRVSSCVHIPGVAYAGAVNPTDAVLATGASWTKVATDNKTIKLLQYLSK